MFPCSFDLHKRLTHESSAHQVFTHSLTHLLTHSPTHSLTHSLISDRFLTIMNHVKQQPAAVSVLEEIFSDNLHIIQTKVRQTEIDMLVNMLVTTEMSVTFIKLLQSTCTCPIGVDSTQRMVVQVRHTHSLTYSLTHCLLSTQALFGSETLGTPTNSVVINFLPDSMTRKYIWYSLTHSLTYLLAYLLTPSGPNVTCTFPKPQTWTQMQYCLMM